MIQFSYYSKFVAVIMLYGLGAQEVEAQFQSNAISPSIQTAVSNFLKGLTNEQAIAEFKTRLAKQFPPQEILPLNAFASWVTNGPAVYEGIRIATTNYNTNPLWVELHRQGYPTPPLTLLSYYTNPVFHHFVPESLNNLCWTNFIANTNGRTTEIWTVRTHPRGWPQKPPIARWNTNCLMWGMKGLTAISPCWEAESLPGSVPVTALTRRHGYAVGHGRGRNGFLNNLAGKKIWFLTRDNEIVEARVAREAVRTVKESNGRDYTILLFDQDLPLSIEPLSVTSYTTMMAKYATRAKVPTPLFMTEQKGHVSAEIPGFTVPVMKGGDSGSPNMIPLPGELVFYNGRTTTGPCPEMQADMDELCRLSGLDPAKYQLQWADLSSFPSY